MGGRQLRPIGTREFYIEETLKTLIFFQAPFNALYFLGFWLEDCFAINFQAWLKALKTLTFMVAALEGPSSISRPKTPMRSELTSHRNVLLVNSFHVLWLGCTAR